ncbi:hypothetical protein JIP62_06310 [Brevundimonas vitis]|uniref:Uncharacterized protein n=1 Tax=Brevundimonas vitisensis TaxID=2800818 RepID=A0ABX7BR18_9CAUL|nr:hypothetical protein [Brevundimonas vitisensis]QQQ19697.1 hypothetical protein JIP62_06310 [Brevundimonas vitisensis]
MSRKRSSRPRAHWLVWSPALADAFRLGAIGDWTPPRHVRASPGAQQMTLSARFTDADGQVMMARLRLRRDAHSGGWDSVSEELSLPVLTIKGGAT